MRVKHAHELVAFAVDRLFGSDHAEPVESKCRWGAQCVLNGMDIRDAEAIATPTGPIGPPSDERACLIR